MYELLAGTPPFDGESMAEVIALILQNQPRPLGEWRPDLPHGFAEVVAKCMRSKPADRYHDLAELAAALAPFGTKADHARAESIARVLGHEGARVQASAPPEAVITRGSQAPSPMAQTLAQSPDPSSAGPPASSARPQPHLDETSVATQGMAASIVASTPSTAAPAQHSSTPLFAGLVLGIPAIGGGGYAPLPGSARCRRRSRPLPRFPLPRPRPARPPRASRWTSNEALPRRPTAARACPHAGVDHGSCAGAPAGAAAGGCACRARHAVARREPRGRGEGKLRLGQAPLRRSRLRGSAREIRGGVRCVEGSAPPLERGGEREEPPALREGAEARSLLRGQRWGAADRTGSHRGRRAHQGDGAADREARGAGSRSPAPT